MSNDCNKLKSSNNNKYYSYILIVAEILPLVFCWICTDFYIDWSIPSINNYIDVSILTSARIVTIIIRIESLVKRNAQIQFFQKLQEVDEIFSKILGFRENHRGLRNQLIFDGIFWALELIIMFASFIVYTLVDEVYKDLVLCVMYILPFALSNIRYFQFVTFVRLLRVRIEIIQRCFERNICLESSKIASANQWNVYNVLEKYEMATEQLEKSLVHQEIILLRKCYYILWESSILINKIFHWTMPFAIGLDFCILVANLYWLFLWFVSAKVSTTAAFNAAVVWSIVNIRHIIIITNICHRTSEQVLFSFTF